MLQKIIFLFLPLLLVQKSYTQHSRDTTLAWEAYQKADTLYIAKKYEEANIHFQRASIAYQNSQYWHRVINCHNRILVNLIILGQEDTKIQAHIQAILQELHPQTQDIENKAYTYFIAAYYALQLQNHHKEALEKYQKAFELYSQTENQNRLIQTMMNLGIVYTSLSNYEKAIKVYTQIIELPENQSDDLLFAETYDLLGVVYLKNKEYQEAISIFQKSALLFQEKLDLGQNEVKKSYHSLLYNFGIVYQETGKYKEAEKYYKKALKPAEALKNSLFTAKVYNALASLYEENEQPKPALINYKKGLGFIDDNRVKNKGMRQMLRGNIAKLFFKMQHYDSARYYNQQILLEEKQVSGEKQISGYKHYYLTKANLLWKEKNYDSTYFYLQKADKLNTQKIGIIQRYYEPILQLNILRQKAEVLEQMKPSEVLQTYISVDTLIQNLLGQYHYQKNQLAFVKESGQIYQNALNFSMKQWKKTQDITWKDWIFLFSEKKKAQILQIQQERLRLNHLLNIPDKVLQEEREIQRKIAYYDRKVDNQGIDSLLHYTQLYRKFIQYTKKQYPKLYTLKYQRDFPKYSKLQKILKTDEAVISYNLGFENGSILVITSEGLFIAKLNISLEDLGKKIKTFRTKIQRMKDKETDTLGKELYQILFLPIQAYLKDKKRLEIIPEGILHQLPFDALKNEKDRFLIEDYLLLYQLSANMIYQAKNKQVNKISSFVGFAPTFMDVINIKNLPHSSEEVIQIDSLFKKQKLTSKVFLEKEANKKHFSQIGENYSCIHLATHSSFTPHEPRKNKLLLYPHNQNVNLYLEEIYTLNIKAELLVLSSCESGLGEVKLGEGIFSLGRAFLYIGIPNVMYSIWRIDDELSKEFMPYFYSNLLQGKSYAESLRETKLKMLHQEEYSSPLWWAGFQMISTYH